MWITGLVLVGWTSLVQDSPLDFELAGSRSPLRAVRVEAEVALAIWPSAPVPLDREAGGVRGTGSAWDPASGWGLVALRAVASSGADQAPASSRRELPASRELPLVAVDANAESHELVVREERLWLGAGRAALGLQLRFGGSTIVAKVAPDSTAAHAGLREGDRILGIDGAPVTGRSDIAARTASARGGQTSEWTVERGGKPHALTIRYDLPVSSGDDPFSFLGFAHSVPADGLPPGTPLLDPEGRLAGIHWARGSGGQGWALCATELDRMTDWLRTERAIEAPGSEDLGRVHVHRPEAFPGYTLYSTLDSLHAVLVDLDGRLVKRWTFARPPWSCYLLPDGDLLAAVVDEVPARFQGGGGICGRIIRQSWDGEVEWDHRLGDDTRLQHHDIEPMPNGNVLALVWEVKTREQAIAAGRDPGFVGEAGMWPVHVLELRPRGANEADVVWEWHAWDHLVQDHDPERANHGDPAQQPGRIDVNGSERRLGAEDRRRLEALGYIVPAPAGSPAGLGIGDWTHMNSIDYHPGLDQILMSARHWSEIWVIDHAPRTEEARGPAGDLLYRWGNPEKYRRGAESDRQLFGQHDARWIEEGRPGAGNILIFNNGEGARNHSSVDEIVPPLDADGAYFIDEFEAFEPREPSWSYSDQAGGFSSSFISGAHRLPNGNTLVCSGAQFRIFEVDAAGEVVWDYRLSSGNPGGGFGFPGAPGFGGAAAPAPGGFDVPGPPGIFRATRIGLDHPALEGRDLEPID